MQVAVYGGAAVNGVGLLAGEAALGGVGLLAGACWLFSKMGEKEEREVEKQVAFEAGAGVSGHARLAKLLLSEVRRGKS